MNISIVSYGHIDSISALSKYLTLNGNKVTLYLVVYDDRFVNSVVDFNLKGIKYGINDLLLLKGTSSDTDNFIEYVSGVECKLVKFPSRSLKDVSNLKIIKQFCKEVLSTNPDVIHFNGSNAFQLLFYYYLRNIPKVYTIHDYVQHSGFESKRNDIYNKIHTKLKYVFIQHSDYMRNKMIEMAKLKPDFVKTIYYAPFDYYNIYHRTGINDEKMTVTFIGRLGKYKGLKYFCEAAESVYLKNKDIEFIILGKGDADFDINYYVSNFNVKFINRHITNQELADYVSNTSLVIVPYTDATQSGVVITAYTFNKPVIATKVGGIPEVVIEGETGILVEPKSSREIAENIIMLYNDRKKLEYMTGKIQEYRKSGSHRFLNWENIAEETVDSYKFAIEKFT